MWKIGNIKFNSKVVLAPMAGITSLSYREFNKGFGVAYSVSEMISDAGLMHRNKKTIEYLKTSKLDRPVALQLFGHDIDVTLNAIDFINNELKIDYDILDINLGCPVPKVVDSNSGSAWLKKPNELYKYIKSIVKHSPKPVTVKIRLGFTNKTINVFEVCKLMEKAGVAAIAIHARTREEYYSGHPHFDLIKDLGKQLKIPLIISGNIFTLDDAIKAIKITKAKAVMVARGSIGNPTLIKQIDTYYKTKKRIKDATQTQQINYCRKLAKMMIKEKGERTAITNLRAIAPKFFTKFKDAKKIRCEISQTIKNYKDLDEILDNLNK